jgi:hypothetical protein
MATTIKIKQIDLQGILSASSQVDLLSASNYTSFVNQLDTTMSSDAELTAVSSSISQSIYTINQTLGSSLVSSSSQLTSSFDERYILSGSIPSIPTESFATTGSNIFIGNQTISGSLVVSQIISNNAPTVGDNVVAGETGITYSGRIAIFREDAFSVGVWNDVQIGWTVTDNNGFTDTIASIGGFGVASFVTNVNNWPSPASGKTYVFTSPDYQQGYINSITISVGDNDWIFDKDTGLTFPDETIQTTAFTGIPTGSISSSAQISDLGFVTGSYTTINSFNSLTQSFNSISQSFNVISGSVGTIDFSTLATTSSLNTFTSSVNSRLNNIEVTTSSYETKGSGIISGSSQLTSSFDTRYSLSGSSNINTSSFATTGSNSFSGSQTITGSLIVSSVAVVNGALTIPSASVISLTSGSSISVDASGAITGSLTGSVFGIGDVVAFSASLNSRIISGSAIAGTISGSSQLTSSYDTRYTLSGSVQPLPSNLVSSSAQITAFGFISSSTAIPAGTISGSSQLTSSFDTRYILSGSLTAGSNVSVSDTAPTSPTEGDLWWKSNDGNLYVYYDSYWIVATDTISAIPNGVISGSAQITTLGFVSGSYETTGRGIISGSAQLPSGLISGSTQLTTSFPSKTTGTWSVPAGASTQSFTVDAGGSYTMWVSGNILNGIISWNATVTTSNTNVPVIGSQFGWYYVDGNALVLTSIPDQIIGTNGGIISSPSSYPPNTSNVFKFGITNNSGTTQTINYGYIKLS